MLYIRIALIAGLFIAAPLIFWQVWLFVAPALYAKERRYAIPFVVLSSIGFIGGRGVFALRRVSADVAVLRELLERHDVVHAAHRRHVQHVHAHAAGDGGCLSDAGAGVLPRADGRRHGALDDRGSSSTPCSSSSSSPRSSRRAPTCASQMIVGVPDGRSSTSSASPSRGCSGKKKLRHWQIRRLEDCRSMRFQSATLTIFRSSQSPLPSARLQVSSSPLPSSGDRAAPRRRPSVLSRRPSGAAACRADRRP